jgi:HK97 gp10 family phage protein
MTDKSFAAAIDEWTKQTEQRMTFVLKESAQRVFADMDRNIPVDTGFARASLQVAINAPLPPLNAVQPEGLAKQDPNAKRVFPPAYVLVIAGANLGDTITAGYTANYAGFLEYGSGTRPPRAFVRGAAQRWPQIVKGVISEARARSSQTP